MIFNDDDAPRISMNGRQKLFILGIDLAILIELCVAMAAAASAPDTFTPTFMRTFFIPFLPTLALGIIGFRKLRDREESARS
jgi:hypothetical protein